MVVTSRTTIPRSLHQIWFGPKPPPRTWMRTWQLPGWDVRLWRESDVEQFGLANAALWRQLTDAKVYDAASDVARIEILGRLGGVYADADSVCLRPLDDAPFMDAPFFAVQEIQPNGKPFVTNAFMGCKPGSVIAAAYVRRIGRSRVRCHHGGEGAAFCCAWKTTGPLALTATLDAMSHVDERATVLPPAAFFTHTITGEPIDGEHWAEHYWSSTGERSPVHLFPAARSYREGR